MIHKKTFEEIKKTEPKLSVKFFQQTVLNRIARVLFVVDGVTMVLLHGFIKKDQKTPKQELNLAKDRLKKLRGMK